jgi:hypothetical protein
MRHLLGCGVVQTVLRTVCTKELRSRPRRPGKGSIQALHPDKSDQKLGVASAWAVFLGRDSASLAVTGRSAVQIANPVIGILGINGVATSPQVVGAAPGCRVANERTIRKVAGRDTLILAKAAGWRV